MPPGTTILLGDNAFAIPPTSPNSVVRLLGHEVVVTSTGAESGGPGPTAANDPLALRQRLLSEAALRLEAGDTAPLVVTLPTVWRGEDAASFFTDLEQPWLDLVPVGDVAARTRQGRPGREPRLHRRRHRGRARPGEPSPRPPRRPTPPRCSRRC